MCGIFGYAGEKRDAREAVLEGLQRLEYRGYDSWGIGVVSDGSISVDKHVGLVGHDAGSLPKSHIGIGHTRWATHGRVTDANAHPHYASDRSFALAHNGIVENAPELKSSLQKDGYKFISETDTEVIVRLIERHVRRSKTLAEAVRLSFKDLEGRNTIIMLSRDGEIIAARNGSPLVLGIGSSFEIYLSSDVFSCAPHVKSILVLNNGEMIFVRGGTISLASIATGKKIKQVYEKNLLKDVAVSKGSYEHYMLKEICEAPFVIRQVVKESDAKYQALARAIKKARRVYTIGSGTAGAAAAQTAFYLRLYGHIDAKELIGAEAYEYKSLIGKDDVLIAPSQSGETADVLEVLELAHARKATIASFVNMPGSMMTRLSDHKFMANAGPEICVMSTKIFVSQIAWGYLVAKAVEGKLAEGKRNLKKLATEAKKLLADEKFVADVKTHASRLADKEHLYLLGKGQNLQIIREGMVKIIEGSYVHAHAIPAGDLKHYAITLMAPGVSVITAVSNDEVLPSVLNAIHEVRARGSSVFGIAPQTDENFDEFLAVPDTKETSAILNIIPLQLLAYYMAAELDHNVDKPRNIAKSVTVK
jgi:glucosamine--fructose-6-phosphate aminotransferase (isomerizing)